MGRADLNCLKVPRRRVIAVLGAGRIGLASARRLAWPKYTQTLLLADNSQEKLDEAAAALRLEGHYKAVHTHLVDVTNLTSVLAFAKHARRPAAQNHPKSLIETFVHAAGASRALADPKRILDVDLVGTAHAIEALKPFICAGSAMVCVASMAQLGAPQPSPELVARLAAAEPWTLLHNREVRKIIESGDSAAAYSLAKAASVLRIQAAAKEYSKWGARINSISPGAINTDMPQQDQESALQRAGLPDEIANTVFFLAAGSGGSYITGKDLLVDGSTSAGKTGALMAGGGKNDGAK